MNRLTDSSHLSLILRFLRLHFPNILPHQLGFGIYSKQIESSNKSTKGISKHIAAVMLLLPFELMLLPGHKFGSELRGRLKVFNEPQYSIITMYSALKFWSTVITKTG